MLTLTLHNVSRYWARNHSGRSCKPQNARGPAAHSLLSASRTSLRCAAQPMPTLRPGHLKARRRQTVPPALLVGHSAVAAAVAAFVAPRPVETRYRDTQQEIIPLDLPHVAFSACAWPTGPAYRLASRRNADAWGTRRIAVVLDYIMCALMYSTMFSSAQPSSAARTLHTVWVPSSPMEFAVSAVVIPRKLLACPLGGLSFIDRWTGCRFRSSSPVSSDGRARLSRCSCIPWAFLLPGPLRLELRLVPVFFLALLKPTS